MSDPGPHRPIDRQGPDRAGRSHAHGRSDAAERSDPPGGHGRSAASHGDGPSRARPPGMRLARTRGEAIDGVEQEMAAEHAATLGRITAALVDAVAAWQALADRTHVSERERNATLDQVSRAAWHVLVQRESLGMGGDHLDWIARTHDVPSEALARLGVLGVLVDDAAAGPRDGADEGIPSLRRHALWSRRGG